MVIDLTGKRFGRLAVKKQVGIAQNPPHEALWECECDCGNTKTIRGGSLRRGLTKSCGCYHSTQTRRSNFKRIGSQAFQTHIDNILDGKTDDTEEF